MWENELPGGKIFHGTWSNPTYAVIKGRPQVIFPGGDGWVYSLEPKTGKLHLEVQRATRPGRSTCWAAAAPPTRSSPRRWSGRTRSTSAWARTPSTARGSATSGRSTPPRTGDITGNGVVWHRGGNDFHRTISTVAIHDGIVYAADLSGFLYALDAHTGQHLWTHDMLAAVWGSPFVADGQVYLGDEDGDVEVLKAGKTKQVLGDLQHGRLRLLDAGREGRRALRPGPQPALRAAGGCCGQAGHAAADGARRAAPSPDRR